MIFNFDNPLDPTADGRNPIVDGIRYHIRESLENKEKIIEFLDNIEITGYVRPLDILEYAMNHLHISDSELIIADEHELLDYISEKFGE